MSRTTGLRLRGAAMICVGMLAFGALGCQRGDRINPDAMKLRVGREAFAFFRVINNGNYKQAALFFSNRLKKRYPDPTKLPLIADRIAGHYVTVVADKTDLDWHNDSAVLSVTFYKVKRSPGKNEAPALIEVGKGRYRWIREDKIWRFDGPASP